jgi:hypothetical protein
MFPIVQLFTNFFLEIAKSHIETKHIFSTLTSILTNLHQCMLQINNLEKLLFVHKNWLHGPRLSCKGGPKSMVDMIELEIDLKKELEEEYEKIIEKKFDV